MKPFCSPWGCVPNLQNLGEYFSSHSLEIVHEGLHRLKMGGSPGVDGIPAEILHAFPDVMVPHMFECIQLFFPQGLLPPSWTEGVVTMPPKPLWSPQ